MSEENLSDLLERTADRHKVSTPPLDLMIANSRRSRKRRAGLLALAASVVVGTVIAGTTLLFDGPDAGDGSVLPAGTWKTVEYKGVLVDIPAEWEKSDVTGCEFPFEGWSSPEADPCAFTEGVTFYGSALFDPANREGTIGARSDGSFMGWVYAGDFAVSVSGPTRELIKRVLDSARDVDASPARLDGEWKVTALSGPDGRSLLLEGQAPTLRFLAANSLTGIAGCNGVAADYHQSGNNELLFSNIRMIAEARAQNAFCADPPLAQRLADVRHATETNGKLQLHAENWMIIAVLERVSVEPDIKLPSTLSESEFSTAVRVAKEQQAKVTGTFVGATAVAQLDGTLNGCPGGRHLHIRLVWEQDAGFDYSAPYGVTLGEGPRKALLLVADAKTGSVCEIGSKFQDVGAFSNETLLYGQWPDPKDS